jgi:hypothetical protein
VTDRSLIIAAGLALIAGFAVLGAQVGRLNGRIDRLATQIEGFDAAFGVKFEETNAKLDAISPRLAAQLKTMEAEIAAQISAIARGSAAASSLVPPAPAPVQPESTPASKPPPPLPLKSRR